MRLFRTAAGIAIAAMLALTSLSAEAQELDPQDEALAILGQDAALLAAADAPVSLGSGLAGDALALAPEPVPAAAPPSDSCREGRSYVCPWAEHGGQRVAAGLAGPPDGLHTAAGVPSGCLPCHNSSVSLPPGFAASPGTLSQHFSAAARGFGASGETSGETSGAGVALPGADPLLPSVAPIPEPSVQVLLALGLIAVLAHRRCRQSRASGAKAGSAPVPAPDECV
jgi:hypothetical protein